MSCFRPLQAYKSNSKRTEKGKSLIVFNPKDAGHSYEFIELPCGVCEGCRKDRAMSWALRCVHEASMFDNNCFITLTFDDANLNQFGSLDKRDFQLFMKRLRKKFKGMEKVEGYENEYPIRYFHCGEYGSNFDRPHHHACIFNFDFLDREIWSVHDDIRSYRSTELERLWPYGYSLVGDVTFASALYIAKYITKKVYGDKARAHYANINKETGEMNGLVPEYVTMSRRPGIGSKFFERYKNEIYVKDFITHKGQLYRPSTYYDKLLDKIDPKALQAIKKQRKEKAEKLAKDNTRYRLVTKEKLLKLKNKLQTRGFENGSKNLHDIGC